MLKKIATAISNLNLSNNFSSMYGDTLRTDDTDSDDDTLESSRRNHDIQPLRYLQGQNKPPHGADNLTPAVAPNNRMGSLVDKRILEP